MSEEFKIVMVNWENFSAELAGKPMILVASKIDVAQDSKRISSLKQLASAGIWSSSRSPPSLARALPNLNARWPRMFWRPCLPRPKSEKQERAS